MCNIFTPHYVKHITFLIVFDLNAFHYDWFAFVVLLCVTKKARITSKNLQIKNNFEGHFGANKNNNKRLNANVHGYLLKDFVICIRNHNSENVLQFKKK